MMIGSCWIFGEALSGLHVLILPLVVLGWLIGGAMWLPGGKLPWHFGLPAVGVTLVVSLILDICSGWCIYFAQTGYTEEFSPLTALMLFPAHWRWMHLFAYGLAAAVAYRNSYDRASWKSRPAPADSKGIADYSAITAAVAEQIHQPPPHQQGISPRLLIALLLLGLLGIVGWALFARCRASVRDLALNSEGQLLAVVHDEFVEELSYQDLTTGQSAKVTFPAPRRIAWAPDGKHLAWLVNSGSSNNSPSRAEVHIFNRFGIRDDPVLEETSNAFRCLDYDPDGQMLAIGDEKGEVLIWDIRTRHLRARLSHNRAIESLAFSPTPGLLAVGLSDGGIALWDPVTLQPIRSWRGHSSEVRHLRFHPKGKVLVSAGGRDQSVRAWDPEDGSSKQVYAVPMNWVMSLAISPDGETLAVSGGSFHRPGEVWLFDIETGQVRRVHPVESNTVAAVAFSSDGKTLFAGTRPPINPLARPSNGQIKRWDLATGQELPSLR
jgi:hypothetical protein